MHPPPCGDGRRRRSLRVVDVAARFLGAEIRVHSASFATAARIGCQRQLLPTAVVVGDWCWDCWWMLGLGLGLGGVRVRCNSTGGCEARSIPLHPRVPNDKIRVRRKRPYTHAHRVCVACEHTCQGSGWWICLLVNESGLFMLVHMLR